MNQFKYDKPKKELWADWKIPQKPKAYKSNIFLRSEYDRLMKEYSNRLHYTVSSELDKLLEDGQVLKENEFVLEQRGDKIRCTCRCHSTPGMVHIAACCHNGFNEINKRIVAIPLPEAKPKCNGNCKPTVMSYDKDCPIHGWI